ncbi:hypothetical protein COCNU_02G014970 [Cocos nucifera]|uniref:Uncharacterized protein n=1 Tax=Cocos nucifera TaxID=13894 RepID=A0A8K0I0Z7_COCNU|nr:hypothetical protein COCNU_02G014970 [Cocos nucifera]
MDEVMAIRACTIFYNAKYTPQRILTHQLDIIYSQKLALVHEEVGPKSRRSGFFGSDSDETHARVDQVVLQEEEAELRLRGWLLEEDDEAYNFFGFDSTYP